MPKKLKTNEKLLRKLMMDRYQKELEELRLRGKENYRPKFGRRMKQLEKRIAKIS